MRDGVTIQARWLEDERCAAQLAGGEATNRLIELGGDTLPSLPGHRLGPAVQEVGIALWLMRVRQCRRMLVA
jgi:hypothetical protein